MKNSYLLGLLFAFSGVFAQNQIENINRIAEAERKSQARMLQVQVNPNTQNYDINYHKLEFTLDPAQYFVSGKITTTYTALSDMSTLVFDLSNSLTVTSVKRDNLPLNFSQNQDDELVIELGAMQNSGTAATVEIVYSGEPPFWQGAFTTEQHNGVPVLFTLSEPFGAKDWWPCKQDLNDKIDSIDVYLTAPSQYVSVANGVEIGQTISGSSKTTHFHHGYPIPAYLIAIAVTNYTVFTQTAGTAPDEFPIVNYVYPENLQQAQQGLAVTPAIMDLFEDLFETYPFSDEKYGHAQFGWGGGMEHTTVSFMGSFDRELVAHELAHQWFGNKITCGSWKDIWLNEGFATYLAAMVIENFDGLNAFVNWKASANNFITSSPNGNLYLTDAQALNSDRIFSSRLSYTKGAMVLEMLRWKLGDTAFFQGLKNYLSDPELAYAYAVTPDLQTHLETASGMDLDGFFADWVYNQGYPSYAISAQNIGSGMVRFTINQTQSNASVDFFEMPVPVRVMGANGEQLDLVLENTTNGQTFDRAVPFAVSSIVFDPQRHIISRDNTATLGTASFQHLAGAAIYPNPANEVISVSLPNGIQFESVSITNILGQLELTSLTGRIDVSGLAQGVHLLTLKTDNGTRSFKFIKE